MNLTKRKSQKSHLLTSVPAGLADLAQAFHRRGVVVGSIALTRGSQTYEHKITENSSTSQLIKAQFGSVTITVSCLSAMTAKLTEVLQARATYAAIAAVDWKEVPTQLALVETAQTQVTKMIGVSKQMQNLIADIDRAARSTHVVLILGESGTGKTTAALMIHERSSRSNRPFVDVNCAAIPDSLLESELFGHERGSFTGAIVSKKGLFELADHGTLFLDEIGELKIEVQAKLLAAIEQQKIRRIGGTRDIECDVRIIAASSRDLRRMIIEGKFREDLYYRLAVLDIDIPPLRERTADIPHLIRDRLIHERNRSAALNDIQIEDAAIEQLSAYNWPGNVRQLHNAIARLSSRAEAGIPITADAARKEISRFNQSPVKSRGRNTQSIYLPSECHVLYPNESLHQFTARVNRNLIEAVRESTGSMAAASIRLGYNRTALSKLLTRLRHNMASMYSDAEPID